MNEGKPAGAERGAREAELVAVQCAWCRLWRVDVLWVAARPGALKGLPVSHGICPACFEKVKVAA